MPANHGEYYRAPWSRKLWLTSLLYLPVIGLVWWVVSAGPRDQAFVFWFRLMFAVLVLSPLLCVVRGYTVTRDFISVHRLCWTTRIPLADFQSAQVEPAAMDKAWRLAGNGGALAFTGFYRNGRVGLFRAFVTDPQRAVVVRTAPRTYVLSPDDPEGFVQQLTASR